MRAHAAFVLALTAAAAGAALAPAAHAFAPASAWPDASLDPAAADARGRSSGGPGSTDVAVGVGADAAGGPLAEATVRSPLDAALPGHDVVPVALPAITVGVPGARVDVGPSQTDDRPVAEDEPPAPGPAAGWAPLGSTTLPAVAAQSTLAAAAAVAVGLALRALASSPLAWIGRAVRAACALAPGALFSRIDRGEVLDNPVRARVHDAVAQDPGLTTSEVQARAGIAWGTTVHHLRRLEAHGLLVSVRQHPNRRYYVANTAAAAQRVALAAVQHPTAQRIATLVALQPGIDQGGVCRTLGLNGPAASKHLGQFREHGLVLSRRVGRRTVHHPTTQLRTVLGLMGAPAHLSASAPEPGLTASA